VLVRINLFIVELQKNCRQHNNFHILRYHEMWCNAKRDP